jgi:Holliday junction DNA helicase RuvA
MIDSLRGELLEKSPGHCVVECAGVGYLVHIAGSVFAGLPERGPVRLHIHYGVSVDVRSGQSEHKLFGFLSAGERHLFRQLIDVQGVSSTIGLAIMGARPADDLRVAIMNGDEHLLKSIKGIGPKLAQRIVTELRAGCPASPWSGPWPWRPVKAIAFGPRRYRRCPRWGSIARRRSGPSRAC